MQTTPQRSYTLSLHDALPICERMQRPEALFRRSEHGPPPDPSEPDDKHKDKERPEPVIRRYDFSRKRGQPCAGDQRGEPEQDRKSTRLNSSHLGISYAVFCLK